MDNQTTGIRLPAVAETFILLPLRDWRWSPHKMLSSECVSLIKIWKYWMLHKNCFMTNVCRREGWIVLGPSRKVPDILVRFWTNLDFLDRFRNTEIRPVGTELITCGRTDRHDEAVRLFSRLCQRAWKPEGKRTLGRHRRCGRSC